MKILSYVARTLAVLVVAATVLPFIRTDKWYVRVFDFPRMQIMVVGLLSLFILMIFLKRGDLRLRMLFGLLVVALFIQARAILPYTSIWSEQVRPAGDRQTSIKVMVANLMQFNRNSHLVEERVLQADPDVVLLTETDQWWTGELEMLQKSHPHFVLQPQDNTYGMNLYSRFPIRDAEVRFLIDPAVPSIRCWLVLENGRGILFHGVHPRPPGISDPDEEEIQDSDQRDAELVLVAKEVVNVKDPIIVAGDFNDVAWSHTTRLFQRTGKLLDPRVGRGMFSTFHAEWPLLRYPLDHLFHSEHFTLVDMQRLDPIGSDHFPIEVSLALEPEAAPEQTPPEKKSGDEEEAQEILKRVEE